MRFSAKLTTKGQITLPKEVRDLLGLKKGMKLDFYPTKDGEFIAKPHRVSRILDFGGNLKQVDDGKPFKEIRESSQALGSKEKMQGSLS